MKIIETIVVLVLYLITKKIWSRLINKTLNRHVLHESRGLIIKQVINIILLSISLIVILLIWGVNQADLGVFIGSTLTVLGVAFFAQWSILSNITSSIILFFNSPIRLNDSILILEGKDYIIEGRVIKIGLFFITLHTSESEEIILPNNLFIQKSIKKTSRPLVDDDQKVD